MSSGLRRRRHRLHLLPFSTLAPCRHTLPSPLPCNSRCPAGRPTPAAARRRRRRLLAVGGLALALAAAALLYRWAPQLRSEEAASEEARRDVERELQLLHEQPSREFCGLPAPRVCAHGGAATAAPPNTAAAFAAALAGGARCVEVDVARTKDGQLVVLHARELAHLLQLAGGDGTAGNGGSSRSRRRRAASHAAAGSQGQAVLRLVLPGIDQVTLDVKTHTQVGAPIRGEMHGQARCADVAAECGVGQAGWGGVWWQPGQPGAARGSREPQSREKLPSCLLAGLLVLLPGWGGCG